jgi:RimJ/RimL family protein N-acetyltransferase
VATDGATIKTERLTLAPLRVEDAAEMAAILGDERLYEFIDRGPRTTAELGARYERLVAGSVRPDEEWLNWVVRRTSDSTAIGTMQATIRRAEDGSTAYLAWVIGVPWQGRGFASEAARAIVDWLRGQGIHDLFANIHPAHEASTAVARRAGFEPTEELVDGETVWRLSGE